jgi:serine/threonine-protein kinase RsbW
MPSERPLMGEVILEIPARPDYLQVARQVVAAAAAVEPTFRDERIDDLRIVVSEATTNAIAAHTDSESVDRIKIRCNLGDDRIEVEVVDQGLGFDPDDIVEPPDTDDPDRLEWERGLGLPLMKEFADETEIRSSGGGTAVRLVVYKSSTARPEGEG